MQISEIAERIYRFSTFVPEIAAPAGFTFNQYLIDAEELLLFHCGPRHLFPAERPEQRYSTDKRPAWCR